jgi:hypothetical protein
MAIAETPISICSQSSLWWFVNGWFVGHSLRVVRVPTIAESPIGAAPVFVDELDGRHRGDCEEHFGFATLGSFRKTRGTQRLSAFSVYERAPGTEPVWRRPITEIEREPPAFSPIARYSGR